MTPRRALVSGILEGRSDANIRFSELLQLLRNLGFIERVRGSHHIFRRAGIRELLTLQRDNGLAKPYQVRQVRQLLLKYDLETGQ